MMSMKKLIAAAMTLPLALGVAACSSNSGTSSSASSGEGESLTVWAWDPAFNIFALKEAEKIYQKDHPNFSLNIVETSWDDLQPKLTTIAQAQQIDQLPDIFLMQNYSFQKNVANYPDIFSTYDEGAVKWDEFPESVLDSSTVDGQHYGLPFDSGTAISALRTDILQQADFTVDDFTDITWDEFIDKGKVVLEKTGKPMLATVSNNSDLVMLIMQSAGKGLFDAKGNPDIAKNAALKEVSRIYKELIDSGVLLIVNSWDESVGAFTNGNVAGVMNGVWIVASIQTAEDQTGKWAITNLPKLDGVEGATHYSANGGSSWAISANANQELAQDFLTSTFAGSEDLYNTILPQAGAVGYWLPAADSDEYAKPQEFFAGQKIYANVVEYATKVPTAPTGVYHTEARDAVNTALTKIAAGEDVDKAFAEAQSTVEFAMQ